MKLAIFSDIHGNYQALKAIFNKIGNTYDEIIFLGDAIDIGPDSLECVKMLQKNNVKFVLGNHDLYYTRGPKIDSDLQGLKLDHHNWTEKQLKGIKIQDRKNNEDLRYDIEYKGIKLSFIHFFINNEKYPFEHLDILKDDRYKEVFQKEKADYVFYGHNHDEDFHEIDGTKYYGIGSSGCTKDDNTYYYSIEINDRKVDIKKIDFKYDRNSFERRINSLNYPDIKAIKSIFFGL